LRRAWGCFIRKQWLFLYPLVLSIVSTLVFFAVYAAHGERLGWSAFFTADFSRWQYIRDHFLTDFSFTSALWVPVAAGLGFCVMCSLVQAPFFRAITGHRYPLAPRSWREAGRLFLFYFLLNLVTVVAPLAAPTAGFLAELLSVALIVVLILVVFADYVIVFEDVGPITGLRRSLQLIGHRVTAVLLIVIILQLVLIAVESLYGLYYHAGAKVFFLVPVTRMLVETLIYLFANILLIFLYEEIRRQSPA
jgi:hypothetical protein